MEIQLLEIRRQPCSREIVGDNFRSRREAGFYPGFTASPRSTAFFASRPAPSISDGFEVFVQLVIAAMTTAPLDKIEGVAIVFYRGMLRGSALDALWRTILLRCAAPRDPAGASVRRRWARRFARSSSSVSLKSGAGVASVRKSTCSLAVCFDERDLLDGSRR